MESVVQGISNVYPLGHSSNDKEHAFGSQSQQAGAELGKD